jgi:hypothetical protein
MATVTKRVLSGSTDAQSIGISATQGATPITIHTGITGTNAIDEVYLYANNVYSAAVDLVLEWGVSTTTTHRVFQIMPRCGEQEIVAGQLLVGSAAAVSVKAFVSGLNGSSSLAASSGFVSVYGWVNRITQ